MNVFMIKTEDNSNTVCFIGKIEKFENFLIKNHEKECFRGFR